MKKPLSISSPTHAMALAVYFMLGSAGALLVVNINSGSGIIRAMGEGPGDVWATTLMIGGWGALASAIAAKRARRPESNLRLEMLFDCALFVNLMFFSGVAMANYGDRAFSNVVFSLTFGLGALFRAIQIIHDLKLIKQARENPEAADPVMADPRDESVR